jgi:hypothetical protein
MTFMLYVSPSWLVFSMTFNLNPTYSLTFKFMNNEPASIIIVIIKIDQNVCLLICTTYFYIYIHKYFYHIQLHG